MANKKNNSKNRERDDTCNLLEVPFLFHGLPFGISIDAAQSAIPADEFFQLQFEDEGKLLYPA